MQEKFNNPCGSEGVNTLFLKKGVAVFSWAVAVGSKGRVWTDKVIMWEVTAAMWAVTVPVWAIVAVWTLKGAYLIPHEKTSNLLAPLRKAFKN